MLTTPCETRKHWAIAAVGKGAFAPGKGFQPSTGTELGEAFPAQ